MSKHRAPTHVTAHITLTIAGKPLAGDYTVPVGIAPARELVPIARRLIGTLVDRGVESVEAKGERVSCRKGCGACCRQLVPVSPVEARDIRRLIESLPQPRRTEIYRRIDAACRLLEGAGLLSALREPGALSGKLNAIGLEYFGLGIACPFLEEESCSIHPDRPVACREYLVTSPAEECAKPRAETVRKVPVAGNVTRALMELDAEPTWVPLVLAADWAERHPEKPETRTGPQMLKRFFEGFVRQRLDVPEPMA